MGQLPADLFAGGRHSRGLAPLAQLGGGAVARIVIVSNRVPVPGRRGVQPGGLAAALGDSLRPGTLWFGWSGRVVAETPPRAELVEHRGVAYAMIDLSDTHYRGFYAGFANGTLWPLLHARLGLMEFERADLEGYVAVNRAFAAALAPLLRPDDLVWVHDYHLIPLGAELRALGVPNRLGFFLHVPFVPASIFGVLPCAELLLRALMEYDLVGVQSEQHRRDLRNAMDEILGARAAAGGRIHVGEQSTRIIANPIGIDAAGCTALA
ncbi:MAG: hypothetical protein FJX57_21330, partial [Alphaproteobacteria bacterium]|nr:hypothetical protein [Alphaproteobacteria bacterium]